MLRAPSVWLGVTSSLQSTSPSGPCSATGEPGNEMRGPGSFLEAPGLRPSSGLFTGVGENKASEVGGAWELKHLQGSEVQSGVHWSSGQTPPI